MAHCEEERDARADRQLDRRSPRCMYDSYYTSTVGVCMYVPASTVKKVLRRWRETGSVETHQGRRLADAHNTIMTHEQSMRLLELVTLLVCCVHLPAAGLGESPRSLSGGVFGDSSTLLAVS